MRTTLSITGAFLFSASPAIASVDNSELKVCLAYSDRGGQLDCCAELGIAKSDCGDEARGVPGATESQPDSDSYFYCKFHNLDGSGEDIARWGKGTDFNFVPNKNIWEWRTEYTIQSIDSTGGYYQRSLNPVFKDQVGKCGPEIEVEYKERMKEIIEKYRK